MLLALTYGCKTEHHNNDGTKTESNTEKNDWHTFEGLRKKKIDRENYRFSSTFINTKINKKMFKILNHNNQKYMEKKMKVVPNR